MKISFRLWLSVVTLICTALISADAAPFTPGNLAVMRFGDGAAPLNNAGTVTFIDEYTPGGVLVQSIPVPPALIVSGTATSEGALMRSPNGRLLCFAGYQAAVGTAGIATTTSAAVPRELAVMDANGVFAVAATTSTQFSGNNVRSGATDGSNNSWGAGGNSGTFYFGVTGPSATVQNAIANTRVNHIQNGNLCFSTASGATLGIHTFAGTPVAAAPSTPLIITGTGSSPYGFAIRPSGAFAYVADDRVAPNGGVQRWNNSGGSWILAYTLATGGGSTVGARGLAVEWSGPDPVIYATTSEATATPNRLIRIVDTGAGSSATTLTTVGANTAFRGVALAPVQPLAVNCPGNITVAATSAAGAVVTYSSSASGGCPPVTVTCNPPSGSMFPIGTTTVTCTAFDACGQTATCTFTVTVNPPAGGDPCLEPDDGSGTVTLPPAGCQYLSPSQVHMIIDGLPPGTTIELAAIHKDFICKGANGGGGVCSFNSAICREAGGALGGEKECAESTLELTLKGTGSLNGFLRRINLPIGFETHVAPRTPGQPVQSFDTEMFRLSGQVTGDPDFDLLRITAGNDFGLPSPGHTTLTQLPGGNWQVDSFFDITYRIDFVGKPGGALGGMSGSTTATIRMVAVRPPPIEIDTFPNTYAELTLQNALGQTEVVALQGPTTVHVQIGPNGETADSDGNGLDDAATEMVAMNLTGVSSMGPVTVSLNPYVPTLGKIEETVNGTPGTLNVPPFAAGTAVSTFAVYPWVQVGSQTLHPATPIQMQALIKHKPPGPGDTYTNVFLTPVDLLNANGQPTGIKIVREVHIPRPVEVDYFPNTYAELTLQKPDNTTETVSLVGPTTVNVQIAPNGATGDSDGNGLDDAATEMVSMNLTGNSSLGPVTVNLNPNIPTLGLIEETANATPGILNVPPFTATGTAVSTFTVYPEVHVGTQTLHPATPINMKALIKHKPPGPGDTYTNVFLTPVDLLNANGQPTGIKIVREVHIPRPVEVDYFPNTYAELTLQKPDNTTETVSLVGPTTVNVQIAPNGATGDSNGNGLDDAATEMVAMNLSGNSSLGPVTVNLNPNIPTLGLIEETANATPGILNVPPFTPTGTAVSTFTVYPEIHYGGQTLHPATPINMRAIIKHKPPGPGDSYTNVFLIPVDLLDANGNPTGIKIVREVHTPKPIEVDYFTNTTAQIVFQTGTGTEVVNLQGPTLVHVQIAPNGATGDSDADGLDDAATEMISMNLTGNSSLGPVSVVLNSNTPTVGMIEETANGTPGILNVPPFTPTGTARSTFTVHPLFLLGGQTYHPATPLVMDTIIRHKPPAPGDAYTNLFLTPVDILDANGNPTGIKILREVHKPNPLPTLSVQCSSNITVTATGPAGAIVNYATGTASGGCPPVTVTCNPPSGSTFPIGTTTVTCTAQDACGQTATCTFTITVKPPVGDPCLEPDTGSGTVTLPPPGCQYLSPDQVHMIIAGLPAGTTIQLAAIHKDFICHQSGGTVCSNDCYTVDDCNPANGATEVFDSTLQLHLTGSGALSGWTRDLTIPNVFCQSQVGPRVPGTPVQSFDTEMLNIQGQLPAGDPDFDLLRITAGSGFGLPSPGHTTLTQLPGGNWAVDSFFDITYRIDFIGHPGGALGGMSGSTTGTIRMAAVRTTNAPAINLTCSSNRTVTATSAAGAVVNYSSSATGGCAPVVVACNPPSGSTFPVGATTVTCTASDACGQSATCSFTVTVVRPPLTIKPVVNGQLQIIWSDGTLQEADKAEGPYIDVDPQPTSPYTVSPVGAKKFYRVRAGQPGFTFYDTEMLQLDISGGSLPAGMMIRESPTLQSTGKTAISPAPGGGFVIDSFFDVFTELSLDGGQNWQASTGAPPRMRFTGKAPSNSLPPQEAQYVSPAQWHALYAQGIYITNASHLNFLGTFPPPPPGGSTDTHTFGSTVNMMVRQGTAGPFVPVSAPAQVTVQVKSRP